MIISIRPGTVRKEQENVNVVQNLQNPTAIVVAMVILVILIVDLVNVT